MSGYRLKTGKTGERVIEVYRRIEGAVVGCYQRIEDAFVRRFLEKTEEDSVHSTTVEKGKR